MTTHRVEVVRDGKWWMVSIPELDGLTQARRLSETEQMAREYIAVATGTPMDDVHVQLSIQVGDISDAGGRAASERDAN